MGKDVDLLKKRSRQRRDFIEKAGSTGLIFSGLVGMFSSLFSCGKLLFLPSSRRIWRNSAGF